MRLGLDLIGHEIEEADAQGPDILPDRSILGHHDHIYDSITISKTLDSKEVPEWFVEYILYHEMLHIKHPARLIKGRRYYHTSAFRLDERRFPYYEQAQKWLDRLARLRRVPRARAA